MRADGSLGAPPDTMAEIIRREKKVAPDRGYWDRSCFVCDKVGRLLRCNDCPCSAHADCIRKRLNDFDATKANCVTGNGSDSDFLTGWRCPECQHKHDPRRHSNASPDVNEITWLLDDIRHVVKVIVPANTGKTTADSQSAEALETSAVADTVAATEFANAVGEKLEIPGTWWDGGTSEQRERWWTVRVVQHGWYQHGRGEDAQESVLLKCLDDGCVYWCRCRGLGEKTYEALRAAWLQKQEEDKNEDDNRNARAPRSRHRGAPVSYHELDDDDDDEDDDDYAEQENDVRVANVNEQLSRKRQRGGVFGSSDDEDDEDDEDDDCELDDRAWLLYRVEQVEEDLEAYLAHQLRTWKFAQGQPRNIDRVKNDPTAFFQLSDYFGKLKPRKSKEAVCEGAQPGISVHGSTIVVQTLRFAPSFPTWTGRSCRRHHKRTPSTSSSSTSESSATIRGKTRSRCGP